MFPALSGNQEGTQPGIRGDWQNLALSLGLASDSLAPWPPYSEGMMGAVKGTCQPTRSQQIIRTMAVKSMVIWTSDSHAFTYASSWELLPVETLIQACGWSQILHL